MQETTFNMFFFTYIFIEVINLPIHIIPVDGVFIT